MGLNPANTPIQTGMNYAIISQLFDYQANEARFCILSLS
jgi:hypothetical protein